jgi:hypothetical protein
MDKYFVSRDTTNTFGVYERIEHGMVRTVQQSFRTKQAARDWLEHFKTLDDSDYPDYDD